MIEATKTTVRDYILREFLPGENPAVLTDLTPLVTGGILNSLAILKLVDFLEEKFGIEIEAHETDLEHFNTITNIAALVHTKIVKSEQAGQ